MKRAAAMLVLLIALICGYTWFSRDQQPASVAAGREATSAQQVASPIAKASATAPAQSVDADRVVMRQPEDGTVAAPASVATATVTRTALTPVSARATAASDREPASAHVAPAAQIAEEVPLQWGITGSNAEGYVLRTDRAVVLSKSASALLESREDTDTSRFGALVQVASAIAFRGKRIELSGYISSVDAPAGASIWLRADDATAAVVAFDNSAVRGIRGTTEWTYQNIVIDIPKEAVALLYGAVLSGHGKLYVDDFQFRVVDASVPVTAKPVSPKPPVTRGRIPDPGREPRNLDFEETAARTDAFSQ